MHVPLENLQLLIAVCVGLIVLVTIAFRTAYWLLRTLAVMPMFEEEAAVSARIKAKTEEVSELSDRIEGLHAQIEEKRQALERIADIRADVDSHLRKIEELEREWEQMEDRKNEIHEIRREAEAARTEKLEIESQLSHNQERMARLSQLLERENDIKKSLDDLTEREAKARENFENLSRRVESMDQERKRLEEAEQIVNTLEEKERELKEKIVTVESEIKTRLSEESAAHADLDAVLLKIRSATSELTELSLKLAVANEAKSGLETEVRALEARRAQVEEKLGSGHAVGGGSSLDELLKAPEVIGHLSRLQMRIEDDELSALKRVQNRFQALDLSYPLRMFHAFHTSMKVSDTTQMTVLAGISGTGKTQLPRQYSAGMGIGFLQVPVQPRWDSPQDLMGFYNYIAGKFRPTELARALYAMDQFQAASAGGDVSERMLMVLLDEMNLARVEYYFSDFLSRLENRPSRIEVKSSSGATVTESRRDSELELEIPGHDVRIFPGYNLLFAGTMNEDESTQTLSDKVIDRSNLIRFGAPRQIAPPRSGNEPESTQALDRRTWEEWCSGRHTTEERAKAKERVSLLLEVMTEFARPFGHRLGRAMLSYSQNYPRVDSTRDRLDLAFSDQVEMRLLPKLRGVDVSESEELFDRLKGLAEKWNDGQLASAIERSVIESGVTGQFFWKGVDRDASTT